MSHFHAKWGSQPSLNHVEAVPAPPEPAEFEMDGELFRLELKAGKRVPVRVNRPAGKDFKGKCWRCERTGHFGRDCTHKAKARLQQHLLRHGRHGACAFLLPIWPNGPWTSSLVTLLSSAC